MLGILVELVLEFEAGVVGFNGAKPFDNGVNPAVEIPLAEFGARDGAVPGIVIGETRVPPNACVDLFGEFDAALVSAGFLLGAIEMDEAGVRDQGVGGLVFASVVINARGFFPGAARAIALANDGVNNIVVWFVELRLREVGNKAFVAAVAVDDEDFLATVAGHLVGGFLEKPELEVAAVGNGAGLVLRFENLAEIIIREKRRRIPYRQRGARRSGR